MRSFLLPMIVALAACADAGAAEESFVTAFPEIDYGRWTVSAGWANGDWQSCEWRKSAIDTNDNTLQITLSDHGGKLRPIGCGEIHTKAKLGYGFYEARMKAVAGSGLNSAFFTYTGPPTGDAAHDEIDFEFLGKDTHSVSITEWADGKTYAAKVVKLDFDASKDFHNYAFEWTKDKIRWYVDGKLVHETPAGTPVPHTPGMLYFSLWSGSAAENDWLGAFSYKEPATAEVKWAGYTAPEKPCQFPQSVKCK